jgi:class 3 adenylate cyclase
VSRSETSPALAAIVAAVEPDLVQYRDRTSPDGMVTIMFTDVVGSTEMMERLGEERWLELMLTHSRLVRECVAAHGGEVVRSEGDGFMLTFASARSALHFAVALQRTFAHHNREQFEEPVLVRVGAHTGNIFHTGEDFLGRAIVLAARISGAASGGEILVSSALRDYTRRAGDWRFGEPAKMSLKGLATVERVYRLDWDIQESEEPPQPG